MPQTELLKCSICGGVIGIEYNGWAGGHNAEPVNDGRCCGACNSSVVIPHRFRSFIAMTDARADARADQTEKNEG